MSFSLNIRRKILIGLMAPAVCLAVLAGFSYSNLLLIERRIQVLGQIDEVEHSLLELRRLARFFLFYGADDEYGSVLESIATGTGLLEQVKTGLVFSEPKNMVDDLIHWLELYRESIVAVQAARSDAGADLLFLENEAQRLSMGLEEQVLSLSGAVRERIGYISESLRGQLLAATLAVASLLTVGAFFIHSQVLKPLKTIERTTRKIAQGNFTPVPVRKNRDEIRELQEAFNSMVSELRNRQEQLVQAQKLSSIGTLSAGIAHQVNNPLNNIYLSAQFLRGQMKCEADLAELKALDNIDNETRRARDIVRGLLDFARQSEFSLRRIRLKTVVENAVRFASSQLPPTIRIESKIPGDLILELDPQRMSGALLNIIMNGIQSMGAGPGEMRVYLGDPPDDDTVTLVIEDSGSGIAPEDVPHIFDPFFTRKEIGKGTGLGLSITYGIIEECRGTVRVESVVGKGTRFFIQLPRSDKEARQRSG